MHRSSVQRVRNPKNVKEIASTSFLFSVVLPEIQEFKISACQVSM
jgi:hypothetical protein